MPPSAATANRTTACTTSPASNREPAALVARTRTPVQPLVVAADHGPAGASSQSLTPTFVARWTRTVTSGSAVTVSVVGANRAHQALDDCTARESSSTSVLGRSVLPPVPTGAAAARRTAVTSPPATSTNGSGMVLVSVAAAYGSAMVSVSVATGLLPLPAVRGVGAEVSPPTVVRASRTLSVTAPTGAVPAVVTRTGRVAVAPMTTAPVNRASMPVTVDHACPAVRPSNASSEAGSTSPGRPVQVPVRPPARTTSVSASAPSGQTTPVPVPAPFATAEPKPAITRPVPANMSASRPPDRTPRTAADTAGSVMSGWSTSTSWSTARRVQLVPVSCATAKPPGYTCVTSAPVPGATNRVTAPAYGSGSQIRNSAAAADVAAAAPGTVEVAVVSAELVTRTVWKSEDAAAVGTGPVSS